MEQTDESSSENYCALVKALGHWIFSWDEAGTLRLSPEGLLVWQAWAQEVEREQRQGEPLAPLRDWASKLAGASIRIAGGLHLALQATAAEKTTVISAETVAAGCLLGRYLRSHALAAFGLMAADPAEQLAERVLAWLKERHLGEFSLRDSYRALKAAPAETTEALRLLEQLGWLRRLPLPETGGRPSSPRWAVHPALEHA